MTSTRRQWQAVDIGGVVSQCVERAIGTSEADDIRWGNVREKNAAADADAAFEVARQTG